MAVHLSGAPGDEITFEESDRGIMKSVRLDRDELSDFGARTRIQCTARPKLHAESGTLCQQITVTGKLSRFTLKHCPGQFSMPSDPGGLHWDCWQYHTTSSSAAAQ